MFYYFAAAANISSDVMIVLIPIPQLWKLRLTLKKKLLLSSIFGVGFMYVDSHQAPTGILKMLI